MRFFLFLFFWPSAGPRPWGLRRHGDVFADVQRIDQNALLEDDSDTSIPRADPCPIDIDSGIPKRSQSDQMKCNRRLPRPGVPLKPAAFSTLQRDLDGFVLKGTSRALTLDVGTKVQPKTFQSGPSGRFASASSHVLPMCEDPFRRDPRPSMSHVDFSSPGARGAPLKATILTGKQAASYHLWVRRG